jgi:hypothetical protein
VTPDPEAVATPVLAELRAAPDPGAGEEQPTLRKKYDAVYHSRSGLANLPKGEPLIDGVLHQREYHVLCGRDSTYKSFLALDWALSIATGTPWNGREVSSGMVLYIAGEGVGGLDDRITAWESHHEVAVPEEAGLRSAGRGVS